MADSRDTGEHFLGPIPAQTELRSQMSARRVADLTTQIDFLDSEIIRYRELLEHERIRHATEIAELQLEADTQIDEVRRVERLQATDLHTSYRATIREHQLQFEEALSEAAAAAAAELADERRLRYEVLERERTRHHALLDATRKQALDEAHRGALNERQSLRNELAQANEAIERLQDQATSQQQRADHAQERALHLENELAAVQRTIDTAAARSQLRVDEAERQTAVASERLEAERQRSAATLAELLGHSASIAAEADKNRVDFETYQARIHDEVTSSQERSQQEYKALAQAADERAGRALQREAELEATIAELRSNLPPARR